MAHSTQEHTFRSQLNTFCDAVLTSLRGADSVLIIGPAEAGLSVVGTEPIDSSNELNELNREVIDSFIREVRMNGRFNFPASFHGDTQFQIEPSLQRADPETTRFAESRK